MSLGSELKHAREREGLSAEQIAERTKVPLYKIEALEDGHFENLPDDIYFDGIIRAYAREIAIDPDPLIRRGREERRAVSDNWTIDFDGLNGVLKKNAPVDDPIVDASIDTRLAPSGFLTPAQFSASHDGDGSTRTVKMAFVLVAALAIAGWGAYFNERTRRGDRLTDASASMAAATPAPETKGVPTPQAEPAPSGTGAEANQPSPNGDATATAGVDHPEVPPRSTPLPATSTAAVATPPGTPPVTTNAAPVTPAHNVSGVWNFTTNVESTSVETFSGLSLGYEIQLAQTGDRVSGTGHKITENGKPIGSQAQTPVILEGTIKGDRLTLTFTEKGTQRDSQGKFVLLADEGTLRGRFSSTAAQSSGTVEAHRAAGTR